MTLSHILAQAAPAGGGSTLVFIVGTMLVFYFFIMRPQIKKQKEARTFESVPLKVTMNEYIDLAKFYSTEKSGAFVNGVLDKLFGAMREDGRIVKTGRGLIE